MIVIGPPQSRETTLGHSQGPGATTTRSFEDRAYSMPLSRVWPGSSLSTVDSLIIDEVHGGSESLGRVIKAGIDRNASISEIVLTGSSNLLPVPSIFRSPAGRRAAFLELGPFPRGEPASLVDCFVENGSGSDFVLESADGAVAALKVENGQTVERGWFHRLEHVRYTVVDFFMAGFALCSDQHMISLGDRLIAAPTSALWEQ